MRVTLYKSKVLEMRLQYILKVSTLTVQYLCTHSTVRAHAYALHLHCILHLHPRLPVVAYIVQTDIDNIECSNELDCISDIPSKPKAKRCPDPPPLIQSIPT